MKNEKITQRNVDFAKWYTDVVKAAKLADYSSVKGCVILEPNGYAIWERMQNVLDSMFKESGHSNVYMPVFIPEDLLKKEGELVKGFAPEVAWITEGGNSKLDERLAFRPTSESLFCDYYSKSVKTYRDLPKLYNQWCSVVRWEKETRPFLRSREFLWQEGHTAHSSAEEAKVETQKMLDIYKTFFEEYLAIHVMTGRKTEKEKFAGAEYTLTVEALMQNGICLQSATSHYFGQKFAKAYDVKFINKENEYEHVYQTSWGASTRMIGALIMAHSDDRGLVLPPKIAPKQVCIIPIANEPAIYAMSEKINELLKSKSITSYIDTSNKSAGFKFAEAEVNGIPIRIEIGSKDLMNDSVTVVRRDTHEKEVINLNNIIDHISTLLVSIQENLYNKSFNNTKERTFDVTSLEEVTKIINETPGFLISYWCGKESCETKMKEIKGIKSRCIIESDDCNNHKCIVCQEKAKHKISWGIQY